MVGRAQISGDGSVTEAVKHTVVGGETIAGEGSTSWIYPGQASSIQYMGTGACKAEIRGGGDSGLETSEYRKLTPVTGWGSVSEGYETAASFGFGHIIPHEFRITDTSEEENKITWQINYNSYGDEEGKV